MNVELLIQHNQTIYYPIVKEGITWATERQGCPGTLKFDVVKDGIINFAEGDPVRMKVDGVNVFYGFVFIKKRDKEKIISVTAYDQLRYFKNKDTYVFENKTASDILKMIASDYKMQVGEIDDTKWIIASDVEENTSLFDIIGNALDATLQNLTEMYVLFDNFGKIVLKNIANLQIPLLIDEETGQNFDYTSSIDSNTYNKIKLIYNNEDTGTREVFIAQDGSHMNQWGVLQYFDTIDSPENGKSKADALLKLYNAKTRNLSINSAFGDPRIHAGCMVVVQLALGDINANQWMLVEKCKHTFKNGLHTMDLTLRGGEFVV